ncbi:ATP-grasp domain-containing protein [Amycolatopsis minnesotensis]|uniref:ATP-grasp domain-containing protein n=1 Tax=Amycolatopsis minnesotensis TaxID=337894 RepID=A0ABN2S0X0_9PSEU
MTAPNFHSRLKTAIGAPGVPLVFLGNLEVEEQWARGECGLPRVSSSSGVAVVNRMDEFALLLAGGGDHVVLKSAPEESYLRYLTDLGIDLPRIHAVGTGDPQRTVTEDALADQSVLDALCSLGALGARLIPHGVSEVEERLVASTGLTLGAPSAAICKTVNSKVYSRRAADELGIPQPKGWAATTLDELEQAVAGAAEVLETGQKVVLKEALGVSGKGISVVDSVSRLQRLQRMIAKQVAKGGYERIGFVIEEWVAKRADLNYQFTLAADGSVHFDFVKEAITEGGVHKGHRFPAALSESQVDILRGTAEQLGKKLHSDGFFGVVGVDAIVGPDGEIHPVIEINARHNMSTYQIRLQDRFLGEGQVAIARHYGLRLDAPLPFAEARATLNDLLWTAESREGLLINNYATVNAAAAADGTGFDGRLYGLIVANSVDRAAELDRAITARLTRGAPA